MSHDPATRWDRLKELMLTPRVWGGAAYGAGDTTAGLVELCCEWIKPEFIVAEVGCFAGVSTRVFALFARTVWAVDAWASADGYGDLPPERLAQAEQEFLSATRTYRNIAPVRALSVRAAARFADGDLDAVYLDADHGEGAFGADVAAWLPKLKPHGLLMGHDFSQVGNYFGALGLPKPRKVYSEDSWVIRVEDIV